jgi:methanogenic corrinoid protein MtbC1
MASAGSLPTIEPAATATYREQEAELVVRVDAAMEERPDIGTLIGDNPLGVMRDNHRNHHRFMLNVFELGRYELLARTLPWVYRAYGSRGFSAEYFPAVIDAWMEAIAERISTERAREILYVYRWIRAQHDRIARLAQSGAFAEPPAAGGDEAEVERTVALLVAGDFRGSLKAARERVNADGDIAGYYVGVLQPALVEIGRRWERNEVSVAEEHLATGVAGRIMAMLYAQIAEVAPTLGRAVVACSANEYHEVGGRMAADLLELDGWEVTYLGANVPTGELLGLLRERKPFLLALSVTMPFNLDRAAQAVRAVKEIPELRPIRVMVGGRAVQQMEEGERVLGADGTAGDAVGMTELARRWWDG